MTDVVEKQNEAGLFYESPTVSILYMTDEIVRTSVPAEGGAEDNTNWWD